MKNVVLEDGPVKVVHFFNPEDLEASSFLSYSDIEEKRMRLLTTQTTSAAPTKCHDRRLPFGKPNGRLKRSR